MQNIYKGLNILSFYGSNVRVKAVYDKLQRAALLWERLDEAVYAEDHDAISEEYDDIQAEVWKELRQIAKQGHV